jgi:hypothetical protein
MIFEVNNVVRPYHNENFKPFQLWTVVASKNGYQDGISERFLALLDNGAKYFSISSKRMESILPVIRDKHGHPLQPVGEVKSKGVYGKERVAPVYILPNLYLDRIHLSDAAVVVPETDNFDCLIGRSILHQCAVTYDPEFDMIQFNFKESLKPGKQAISGVLAFRDVNLFAEF